MGWKMQRIIIRNTNLRSNVFDWLDERKLSGALTFKDVIDHHPIDQGMDYMYAAANSGPGSFDLIFRFKCEETAMIFKLTFSGA